MKLIDREWKVFRMSEIFIFEKGSNKSLSNETSEKEDIDYVGATSRNNGNVGFVSKKYIQYLRKGNCIVFINTGEGSVGDAIYKKNSFIPSNNVTIGRSNSLNEYVGQFIVTINNNQSHKYSYGYIRNETRLRRDKILLPVNSKGEPDYVFMENYMKQKENNLLEKYKKYVSIKIKKINQSRGGVNLKNKWEEFFIEDVFYIKSGRRLTKVDMVSGEIPFIGATDSNNGITEFIANKNSSLDKNVLGVNYNGSVVYNFYHPYESVFSDDVKRLSFREIEGNKYAFLFVKALILQQKSKYEYGYKFNGERMKRQKILLPVNSKGNPDYSFMENYMKLLEYEKLKLYLNYKN